LFPARAFTPDNPLLEENLITIQDNSLTSFTPHFKPCQVNSLGVLTGDWAKNDIRSLIREKYPEMANLLICIAQKESSLNPNAIGDKGKAKGLFQIHTDKHDITDECAFDIECSLDFTAQKIKEGKGFLWTAYKLCLK